MMICYDVLKEVSGIRRTTMLAFLLKVYRNIQMKFSADVQQNISYMDEKLWD